MPLSKYPFSKKLSAPVYVLRIFTILCAVAMQVMALDRQRNRWTAHPSVMPNVFAMRKSLAICKLDNQNINW